MMRALENILDIGLYLLVIVVFAPIYYTMKLVDKLKER